MWVLRFLDCARHRRLLLLPGQVFARFYRLGVWWHTCIRSQRLGFTVVSASPCACPPARA